MLCWSKQESTGLEDDMFGSFATLDPHETLSTAVVCNRISLVVDLERLQVVEVFQNVIAIGLSGVMV